MPIVCAVRRRILGDSSDTADIATVRFKNLLGAQTPRPRLVTLAPICPPHAHTRLTGVSRVRLLKPLPSWAATENYLLVLNHQDLSHLSLQNEKSSPSAMRWSLSFRRRIACCFPLCTVPRKSWRNISPWKWCNSWDTSWEADCANG